jgi:uncharacterized protein (DUF1501 family)
MRPRDPSSPLVLPRRAFVRTIGLAALGAAMSAGTRFSWAEKPAAPAAPSAGARKVLVVLFQRGAVDGLSMVVPYADPQYRALRPGIAIPPPGGEGGALKLDGTFGLHPALEPIEHLYKSGALAVVHAVGSPDGTRSHFDAQDFVETGTPGSKHTEDGFLNRLLANNREKGETTLRAIALAPSLPRILGGRAPVVAMSSLDQFKVQGPAVVSGDFEQMYAATVDRALRGTASEAFDAVKRLREIKPESFPLKAGAKYPASPLGKRMRQIAQVIQADLGAEVVVTDCGGWDTHAGQGAVKGQLANRLGDLAEALAAFATDLGPRLADVCTVTVTEFGRTVKENGTGGTDHGHGSVMMVLGGNVRGKKVYARWKGLDHDALFEGRDLPVTTDHREVFSEVLKGHLGAKDLGHVFPGFAPGAALGLFG